MTLPTSIVAGNYNAVFTSSGPGPAAVQPPMVGTLSCTSQAPTLAANTSPYRPGPVPLGKDILLTAGNAFAVTGTIAEVRFFYSADPAAAFTAAIDLGVGVGARNLPDGTSSNWSLMMHTTGLTRGDHAVWAQAKDSNGLLSDPIKTVFTIL